MAIFTWFNGNQGLHRQFFFDTFDIVSQSETQIEAFYNGKDGPLEPWAQPYRMVMTVDSGVLFQNGNGQSQYSAGVITGIDWYDTDGNLVIQGTGFSADASVFSVMWNDDRKWQAQYLFQTEDNVYNGSQDGMNADGWDGDEIRTGFGDDMVFAEAGDDYIVDFGGKDSYHGGAGLDILAYGETYYNPWMGSQGIVANMTKGFVRGPDGARDTIESIEGVFGGIGRDRIIGNDEDNRLMGLHGRDTLDGGAGRDRVDYRNDDNRGGTLGVVVNLDKGFAKDGFGTRDVLRNIEDARGSDFDDKLIDDAGDNFFDGRDGDDLFIFSKGNDGARGRDGADTFRFKGKNFGDNWIDDFEVGVDKIEIVEAPRFRRLDIENNDDGDAVVSFARGEITLHGVDADDLSRGDFIF